MNWQSRLEKTAIALSLIGPGFGFCIFGIWAKGEPAGGCWTDRILGVVIGALFLLSAFYFCKRSRQGKTSALVRSSESTNERI